MNQQFDCLIRQLPKPYSCGSGNRKCFVCRPVVNNNIINYGKSITGELCTRKYIYPHYVFILAFRRWSEFPYNYIYHYGAFYFILIHPGKCVGRRWRQVKYYIDDQRPAPGIRFKGCPSPLVGRFRWNWFRGLIGRSEITSSRASSTYTPIHASPFPSVHITSSSLLYYYHYNVWWSFRNLSRSLVLFSLESRAFVRALLWRTSSPLRTSIVDSIDMYFRNIFY